MATEEKVENLMSYVQADGKPNTIVLDKCFVQQADVENLKVLVKNNGFLKIGMYGGLKWTVE